MSDFFFIFKQIFKGRSVTRAFFNNTVRSISVRGKVIDIGAGANPQYQALMPKEPGAQFESIDRLTGDTTDFEVDALPYTTASYDTVLSMNVLEHIYNYKWHLAELIRILKPGGKFVMFVPFLYMYHPGHSDGLLDCHRYTRDALERMCAEVGLEAEIKEVSRGVLIASLNMCLLSMPKILRPFFFVPAYALDGLLIKVRPLYPRQFPLGYMVVATKK
jgi:SAM-dependent methyltransferase